MSSAHAEDRPPFRPKSTPNPVFRSDRTILSRSQIGQRGCPWSSSATNGPPEQSTGWVLAGTVQAGLPAHLLRRPLVSLRCPEETLAALFSKRYAEMSAKPQRGDLEIA